jgi:hypothetical protein
MMRVISARIAVLSATAAFEVRAVDRLSNKCEAQGRLRSVAGEGKTLIHRFDRCTKEERGLEHD